MWLSGLRGAMAYALSLCCYQDMINGNGDVILIVTLLISLTYVKDYIIIRLFLWPLPSVLF